MEREKVGGEPGSRGGRRNRGWDVICEKRSNY